MVGDQSPSRVAILSAFCLPQTGGIQVLVDRIARGLSQQWGHTVSVLTRSWPGRPLEDCIHGIRVSRLPSLGKSPLALVPELWRALKSFQPEVLMCVEPRLRWSLPAAIVARMLDAPVVLVLAGTYSEKASPVSRWLAGAAARKVIGVSQYALRAYGYWPIRWRLIYNGVDAEASAPVPGYFERDEMVLAVARVNPRKNLEAVIRTARLLPQYQFVIAGDAEARQEYLASLRRLVSDLRVENVLLAGEVSDSRRDELYRRARVFFLPSLHEMFGIVFAEAMAAGLPIVATDCTAIPEVVTPDVGRLLAPTADPSDFAREVRQIAVDKECWASMSACARKRAARFDWSRSIQGYAEICAEVVRR